jgi:hypothetical protein
MNFLSFLPNFYENFEMDSSLGMLLASIRTLSKSVARNCFATSFLGFFNFESIALITLYICALFASPRYHHKALGSQ